MFHWSDVKRVLTEDRRRQSNAHGCRDRAEQRKLKIQNRAEMGFGGGDVTNWDEDGYRNSVLKERKIQTQTVFRTVFAPSPTPDPEAILVASSDGSLASYSISSCVSYPPPLRVRDTRSQHFSVATPDCYIEGHDGPTYDIQFFGDEEDCLLISCGDDGRIRGWKWKELLKSEVPIHLRGTYLAPVLEFTNPQHKGPWNALSPIPENNGIAIDTQRGSIFAACGDSCAYCWDVEHGKIKMAFKGHSDYLHCVVARSSSNQIITGSEDGTARIWDCASGKCIQVIDPKKDKKSKELFPYVSCIALDASESWLACGSGQSLSIFNLPSRECVSRIPFHGSVQDISFHDNQILAVGTRPLVSRFDINGVLLSEIQSAPQSAFSISVHQSGVMAVAGYGGLVDVISPFGSHLCTFRCQCI